MPRITSGPNGFRISFADPIETKRKQARKSLTHTRRGACSGWSADASARNALALQSIDFAALGGCPIYAVTLTMARCPPNAVEFKKLKNVYDMRLRRMSLPLRHWVCEWAQVGRFGVGAVPHLHLTIFNVDGVARDLNYWPIEFAILRAWCEVFEEYGAQMPGQHLRLIDSPKKWVGYVAKHTARAARHAQREQILPEGWESPGRMWGMSRNIPTRQNNIKIDHATGYDFRRMALRYLRGIEAVRLRKTECPKKKAMILRRIVYLRRHLKKMREVSEHLPMTEFVEEHVTYKLLKIALQNRYDPEIERRYG